MYPPTGALANVVLRGAQHPAHTCELDLVFPMWKILHGILSASFLLNCFHITLS